MAKGRRSKVSPDRWSQFHHLAIVFKDAALLAQEFEYWNAAGVLIVHAAIAFTDALTVKMRGVKSGAENHHQAGQLVQETVALETDGKRALKHFFAIIEHKTLISYSGWIYRRQEIITLWKHLERYRKWVESMLKG